jgi:hypothetical protein
VKAGTANETPPQTGKVYSLSRREANLRAVAQANPIRPRDAKYK